MQRDEREVVLGRELRAGLHGATDLRGAGQEHEDVTVEAVLDERAHRGGHLEIELAVVGGREVLDGDVEALAFGAHHLAPEERGDGAGVERGRHGDDA